MKKLFFLMLAIALFAVKGFAQEQYSVTGATIIDNIATAPDNSSTYEFDPDIAREFANEMDEHHHHVIDPSNDILGIPLNCLIFMLVLFTVNILICWLIVLLYYNKIKREIGTSNLKKIR